MSNKALGATFICIAAFIFAIPYYVPAIAGSGKLTASGFSSYFEKICTIPIVVSACMLAAGIFYLVKGEKTE
jgi:ABC-type Fe3+ transport system permease subunit